MPMSLVHGQDSVPAFVTPLEITTAFSWQPSLDSSYFQFMIHFKYDLVSFISLFYSLIYYCVIFEFKRLYLLLNWTVALAFKSALWLIPGIFKKSPS